MSRWLIGKSALVCLGTSPDSAARAERIGRGVVHVTTVSICVGVQQPRPQLTWSS